MKIVKASNGKTRITLSKKEWEKMGSLTGWINIEAQEIQEEFSFSKDYPILEDKSKQIGKKYYKQILNQFNRWDEAAEEIIEGGPNFLDILNHFGIDYDIVNLNGHEILSFKEDGDLYVSEDFRDISPSYEAFDRWIYNIDADKYMPMEEENFWESPSVLYHGTTEDKWEEIQNDGYIQARSDSRAMSNRGMGDAVFTSLNEDGVESYGEVTLEIDTLKMKNDGYMPEVSGEEPLIEMEQRSSIAHALGSEDFVQDDYSSEGLDVNTIAIFGDIPIKYVRLST